MYKFSGFTLAEVLITLGIIGVVAAMTIPVLIANTRSAKYRSQFKKLYLLFLKLQDCLIPCMVLTMAVLRRYAVIMLLKNILIRE